MLPTPHGRPFRIGFLLFPRFALIALSSAAEPLRVANRLRGRLLYEWHLISVDGTPVESSNGMASLAGYSINSAPAADLIVVVTSFDPARVATPAALAWIADRYRRGSAVAGVDTGSYLMAMARMLDGRCATIHWEHLEVLREDFPQVHSTQDVFVADGRLLSAAGGTACMDLMLNLIRAQHGQPLAAAVSDQFIYNRIRSGTDAQRLGFVQRLGVGSPRIIKAAALMEQHLEEPLTTAGIAQAANISLRELERLFKRWLRTTPGAYYRDLRLTRAQGLLQHSHLSITEIALACGFSSVASFSRSYKTRFGQRPSDQRLWSRSG